MTLLLKPKRGGFLRPFGCGWFIREFLLGNGPHGSPTIDPTRGSPQSDIFYHYKQALRRITAEDRAVRQEEKNAKRAKRPINPENIEALIPKYLERLPYKSRGCRYHSFVNYFSTIQKLTWVEPSGVVEPSAFQEHYSEGKPRLYFRLTSKGKSASDEQWSAPRKELYG